MFQISTRLDYGLILMRSLALHYAKGPVSLRVIAEENRLPYRYLMQIVMPLRSALLIRSFEGSRGGYQLSRDPGSITLQDIARVLAPHKRLNRCLRTDHASCSLKHQCSMSSWWLHFNVRFQKMIHDIKLSDLI
ncbi:MAG: hypothetical protein A3B31_03485 [Candidatus Komeilibacteria bacterium RIFCSPLOWO2_01_FULL_53_11]|uniref:Rrf2 family transcriptional regulator n=1 Tax=Candidatus Komeilibacteria bacterium RIFCSPLOWO2_01_FULL_53_11 TaxID=1798552 RepID=A0A1G2BTA0_9BACT|nr:MAG: hypothetical protein A3B31_03485 [Candidatus Komeilibacteria bacterium RIFCSPLOWO2_01_FULL_53_11]